MRTIGFRPMSRAGLAAWRARVKDRDASAGSPNLAHTPSLGGRCAIHIRRNKDAIMGARGDVQPSKVGLIIVAILCPPVAVRRHGLARSDCSQSCLNHVYLVVSLIRRWRIRLHCVAANPRPKPWERSPGTLHLKVPFFPSRPSKRQVLIQNNALDTDFLLNLLLTLLAWLPGMIHAMWVILRKPASDGLLDPLTRPVSNV